MTPTIRRHAALLCALAAAALGAAPASPAAAQDTAAVAVNTKDNSSIFRLAFNIRRVTGDVVDQTNAAVAISSCQQCRTVAISIQVLIAETDPSVVTPENLALAVNQDCTTCDTFALAYQLVLGDGTRLRFTSAGNQSIAQIRRELQALRNQDLSDEELANQVGALVDRLRGVLDTGLVGVGKPTEAPPPASQEQTTTPQQPSQTTPAPAPPADASPAQTTPARTTPAQTTPVQPPAQTTPTTPPDTTTAPTQTTP